MDTQNTADRLHDIMALADAHAYAKIMPDTPREQRPYFFLRAEIQSLLAENETLRHKLQTWGELGAAADDVQLLRMGYAAAQLEIASLQARVNECGAGAGCCAQAARIAELEAQLEAVEAVGAVEAGGMSALVGAPAQPVAHVSQETFNDDGTSDIIIPALPIGMALYAAPQPAAQVQKDAMDSAMEYEPDQPESMPLTKDEIVSMAIEANPWGIDGRLTEVALSAPSTLLRFAALVTAAERRACTAACEKVKQQAKATANSSFVTDAGKDVHNAMAAGAQSCIAAIAARGSNGH